MRALYEVINSGQSKPITRKQIAENQGISEHFLEKIFINLQKNQIIKSVRGPGGGFLLNRQPERITLWDVYISVDDPSYSEDRCYHKALEECVNREDCKVRNIWLKFGKTLKKGMTDISLADILSSEEI